MRFNNMIRENEKKKDISIFIVYAILGAFVCFLFLNILFSMGTLLLEILIRYWWVTLIIFLLFIFFKRRRRK